QVCKAAKPSFRLTSVAQRRAASGLKPSATSCSDEVCRSSRGSPRRVRSSLMATGPIPGNWVKRHQASNSSSLSIENSFLLVRVFDLVAHAQRTGRPHDQTVRHFFKGAEHHHRTSTLIRQLYPLTGDAVVHHIAGLFHQQHGTGFRAIALTAVQHHHVVLAHLSHTTGYRQNL